MRLDTDPRCSHDVLHGETTGEDTPQAEGAQAAQGRRGPVSGHIRGESRAGRRGNEGRVGPVIVDPSTRPASGGAASGEAVDLMGNERLTENIVREHLAKHETRGQVVEEQVTQDLAIAQALKKASKQGVGVGKPEFVITHPVLWPDGCILIECKADATSHESARHKAGKPSTPADISTCAVDGVLHYAKHVSKQRNVIAIAVSGEKKSTLRVSTYRQMKGADKPELLYDRVDKKVERLRTVAEYVDFFLFDREVQKKSLEQLIIHTRVIHDFLRDYAKVTEPEKPLVVSAALLALRHAPFRAAWSVPSDDLAVEMFEAVDKVVKKAISGTKKELMMSAYEFVRTHPELIKKTRIRIKGQPEVTTSPLQYLLGYLEREVLPFATTYQHIDVIGQFYAEFLRYSGGEGQGLGIVLTPRHLTELFVQVAQISRKDTVLDACAGTGGFLISAMIEMDRQAGDDEDTRRLIREQRLIGIEQRSDMFALCVSNMILRGDGRSNLHRGDCFDDTLQRKITEPRSDMKQPNKGLLNPPYSQKGEDQHELDFVKALMDMLAQGGTGVVVVPISCAISPHASRVRLLESHTLVAAMSLPEELFYPVGTITCALVLRAHMPHAVTAAPTWFGYWRNDGFVKLKHLGRVDHNHAWEGTRGQWLKDYRSMAEVPGRCVKRVVTADDEWCAEAYLETDYSTLTEADFMAELKRYTIAKLSRNGLVEDEEA
jgi:type I restriction enzyme M protein